MPSPALRKPIAFGFTILALGQVTTAGIMVWRNVPMISLEYRIVAVGIVSLIVLSGGYFSWYLTCWSKTVASTQPALGVAGALAANLIRLGMPLFMIIFLQTSPGEELLGRGLKIFLQETLVASYLVLLLLDILLHIAGCGKNVKPSCRPDTKEAETHNPISS